MGRGEGRCGFERGGASLYIGVREGWGLRLWGGERRGRDALGLGEKGVGLGHGLGPREKWAGGLEGKKRDG